MPLIMDAKGNRMARTSPYESAAPRTPLMSRELKKKLWHRVTLALLLIVPMPMASLFSYKEASESLQFPEDNLFPEVGLDVPPPARTDRAVEYAPPRIRLTQGPREARIQRSRAALRAEQDLKGYVESAVSDQIVPSAAVEIYLEQQPAVKIYQGMEAHRSQPIASLTKSFTAVATMTLVEDGLIDLDASISRYGVHVSRREFGQITVRDLLLHTSGISYGSTQPSYAPGIRHQYSNGNYLHLATIIENVSRMSYQDYLEHAIFEPLNMRETSASPGIKGSSGISSSVHDLSRFGRMLLNGGTLEEARILRPESIQEMLQPPAFMPISEHMEYYAHGFRVEARNGRVRSFFHSGLWNGTFSEICVYPEDRSVVVQLANPVSYHSEALGGYRYRVTVLSARYVDLLARNSLTPAAMQPVTARFKAENDQP
ncbi:MAG: beta-lactamase family protein [Leptospiraceae bacterium]|nr:beta-lactamase family protein [Leptospiraceae bacterium]MCB1169635.1 beta-lactamase family protein [Leptospiraceae bacterium]